MLEEDIHKTSAPKKKLPKKISKIRLKNIALYYLDRYESSVDNLRDVLKKRVYKYKMYFPEYDASEAYSWIEEILLQLQECGYLDNKRYANMKIDEYLNAGKPAGYIKNKLKQKGIDENLINSLLEEKDFSPLEMALKFAKKKRIGPFSATEEIRKTNRQKDLAKLIYAGFDYDISAKVINYILETE